MASEHANEQWVSVGVGISEEEALVWAFLWCFLSVVLLLKERHEGQHPMIRVQVDTWGYTLLDSDWSGVGLRPRWLAHGV